VPSEGKGQHRLQRLSSVSQGVGSLRQIMDN